MRTTIVAGTEDGEQTTHGKADAQKTMGIITLALVAATADGTFHDLPTWLQHISVPEFMQSWHFPQVHWHIGKFEILKTSGDAIGPQIPFLTDPPTELDVKTGKKLPVPPGWVIFACATVMGLGTMAGGWKIIRTLGHKMVKLQPVHGFAAETAAATILGATAGVGIPLSTTHTITTSIMGVGAMKRFSAVKWGLVNRIIMAWIITLPVTISLGYGINWIFIHCGMK